MRQLTVEVRNKALQRLGLIRIEDLSFKLTARFNNIGEWELVLPIDHEMVPHLRTPGGGIVVTLDDGTLLASGPVVTPEVTASASDPAGTVKISGITDDVILADRLAFPQPSNVDPTAQMQAADVRTGAAETLMHAYVNANIGPGAPAARRDTRLVMGTDGGRGDSTTKRARFNQLGALLSEIAAGADYPDTTGRPMGFRVIQSGATLRFETYPVRDQSSEVRFDVYNGTLTSHKVATSPPTATRVIVAGSGEAEEREFAEVTTSDSLAAEADWGRRIEVLKDQRSTGDAAELTKAGQEELAARGASSLSVEATPADDTAWEFVQDWFLGDRVTVVVDGVELKAVVSGYVLKADASGVRLGATLGDPEVIRPSTEGRVSAVEQRVSNLERNVETPTTADHIRDEGDSVHNWKVYGGTNTGLSLQTVTDAQVGQTVYRQAGFSQALIGTTNIPFDSTALYRVRFRLRLTVAPTVAADARFYVGLAGVASDGVTLVNVTGANAHSSQHYTASAILTVSSAWSEYTAYVSGWAATGTTFATDPNNPAQMHTSTRFIRPIMYLNYPAGDGTTEVDLVEIERVEGRSPLVPFTTVYNVGSYTWTKPAGYRSFHIRVQGGGGTGGGAVATAAGNHSRGSGGGGGGYAESLIAASALTSTVAVTVGSGGTPVSGGGNNGIGSSFGAYVVAAGGGTGSVVGPTAVIYANQGGAGGSASAGDIRSKGDDGTAGIGIRADMGVGGNGGASVLGGGGRGYASGSGGATQGGGSAAGNYGGGGGGAMSKDAGTAVAGGAGGDGVVIITAYP